MFFSLGAISSRPNKRIWGLFYTYIFPYLVLVTEQAALQSNGVVLERAGRKESRGAALLKFDPLRCPPETCGGLPSEGAQPGEH